MDYKKEIARLIDESQLSANELGDLLFEARSDSVFIARRIVERKEAEEVGE